MKNYNILGQQDITKKETVYQILNEQGKMISKKKPLLSLKDAIYLYKWIVKSRVQDEMMLKYQRQGRVLTFAPSIGEEALQVATSFAMDKKKDVFVPGYRVNAALLEMGVPQELIMLY